MWNGIKEIYEKKVIAMTKALGSGLDVLFEDNSEQSSEVQTLRMSEIEPNKSQPRKDFDNEALTGLAESIREHGLIQPIVVRPMLNGITFQIVAGERRWRACRILGMDEIPVIIKELSDFEAAQLAIIENVQREGLNPIEEAIAYKELIENYQMNKEQLAKILGKSRPYISNMLRLLGLPDDAVRALKTGELTVGHAKVLMSLADTKKIPDVLKTVLSEKLSVRQTEALVKKINVGEIIAAAESPEERAEKSYFTEMQLSLTDKMGRKVRVKGRKDGGGTISFEFSDRTDLCRLSGSLIFAETGRQPEPFNTVNTLAGIGKK